MGKLFLLFRMVRLLGVARVGVLAAVLYLWRRR